MYWQIFNNIEVNGTLTWMIRTYDSKKHKFWLPQHVQNMGNDFLHKNKSKVKKEKTVKVDSDILMGNFKIVDPNTIKITDYTCLDPNPPFSLPNVFVNLFVT